MDSNNRKSFQIKLEGDNASPKNFTLNETYYILKDFQDAIKSESENPEENTNLYLTSLEDKCVLYNIDYQADNEDYAMKILNSIGGNYFADLKYDTVKILNKFKSKIVNKGVWSEFYQAGEKLAEITRYTQISIQDIEIKDSTTIYAEIERVGGVNPTVRLKLLDGKSISVEINKELAKEISNRLYMLTGFTGVATWNKLNKELLSFNITDIIEFEDKPYKDTFDELRDILAPDLDKFKDFNDMSF